MDLRDVARSLAERFAPGREANRARHWQRAWREERGITEAGRTHVAQHGASVTGGPFIGLRYPADRIDEVDTPIGKLTGVYEDELGETFRTAATDGTKTFIDIGCADGYYAVGMAVAVPGLTTYAFDLARSARDLCGAVAVLNDVQDRVVIGTHFTPASLKNIETDHALVLCDIEGAESTLWTIELMDQLQAATIVIEVHEDSVPGVGVTLTRLLEQSHEVERVAQRPAEEDAAVAENRPPLLHWVTARPRS